MPIVEPSGAGPAIWVNPVPEAKSVKNRMHIDVVGDTATLLAAGATLLRSRDAAEVSDPESGLMTTVAPGR